MSKKWQRVIAIIALVFVGIFTVSLIFNLVSPDFLNGNITAVTLSTGGFGLALFLVVWLNKRAEKKNEQYEKERQEALALETAEAEAAVQAVPPQPKPAAKAASVLPESAVEDEFSDEEKAARKTQPPAKHYPLKKQKKGKRS